MGPVEEVSKTANTFIEAMKSEPLSLALCVMNLVLLGIVFYIAHIATETRRLEFTQLITQQTEMSRLLYNCVPSDRRSEMNTGLPPPLPLQFRPDFAPPAASPVK